MWEGEGGGRGEEGMVMAVWVVVVVGLRRVVHHHCRLRLERRGCDASRRVGHRRVYACGEREREKSGWMRFS